MTLAVVLTPAAIQITRDDLIRWFIGTPMAVVIILVISVALRFVLFRIINRVTRRLVVAANSGRLVDARRSTDTAELTNVLMSQRREQRAGAIAALLRSTVTAFITGISILMILSKLGVNIAPLVASAGVLGVALGFGAQSLVRDYLSGIFMIVEDQFGVGDVVDLGPVVGSVEDVALRVTRVRDLTGVLWYVRNGEILRVANRSQGWTLSIVDVPIAYTEDINRVREVIEALADDMDTDDRYDGMLLGKPDFAGVESVSGDAVFVRVIAKAAPEQQIPVARILRERIKSALDDAGIHVPVLIRPNIPGAPSSPQQPPPSSPGF